MPELPKQSNVFMGVSLSNGIFNSDFTKQFMTWIGQFEPKHVEVVIFNDCETVNIQAFSELPREQAQARSNQRSNEMARMFQKLFHSDVFHVTTQSETARKLPNYSDTTMKLQRVYEDRRSFFSDVREQIRTNIPFKLERFPENILEEKLDQLSEYVILEIAWFYEFFRGDTAETIEVHPGPEMFTKRKMVEGKYQNETGIPALERQPAYFDITSVIPHA